MRLSKRFILGALLLILVFSLMGFIGCKGGNYIKVAAIAPLGEAGEGIRNAIKMAVEEVNAAGGILNQKVRIIWVTEGKDAAKLQTDLTQAIETDKCKFIIGGYSSARVKAAMKVMKEKKILWLGTGGAHPSIVQAVADDPGMKYYFRVGTLDSAQQGASIARFAISVLKPKGLTKVAYIRVNHSYALEIIKPAREAMAAAGFKTVIEDHKVKFNATDFADFLDKCKAEGVQVIVCSFLLGETKNFIKQVAAKGLNTKIAIVGAMAPVLKDEFPAEVGGAANAAYVTSLSPQSGPVDMTGNGAAVKFAKDYKAKYGKSAYWISYIAYDALRVLKAAVSKAGSLDTNKIISTMEADDFEFVGLVRYKWKKENHDLFVGEQGGQVYADFPWMQFFPDGSRHCVFPEAWKQKEFLAPGDQPS